MIRIITVCGVGMGSSLLLRMYTEDVIKELGVEAKSEGLTETKNSNGCCMFLERSERAHGSKP